MTDRLLTAKQVADLLAVPESWVREATREGRIPHLKLGRYRRYQPAAIEAWLAQQGGQRKGASGSDLHSPRR
jgi:excisionase family DNA binding protein